MLLSPRTHASASGNFEDLCTSFFCTIGSTHPSQVDNILRTVVANSIIAIWSATSQVAGLLRGYTRTNYSTCFAECFLDNTELSVTWTLLSLSGGGGFRSHSGQLWPVVRVVVSHLT
jgi:hypothetical protein